MKTLFALLVAGLLAPPASATVVHYTWGDPDAVVSNQDWAGPMTYRQTLSVTDLPPGPVSDIRLIIWFGPIHVASAPNHVWNMLTPPTPAVPPIPDCTGGPGFAMEPAVSGAVTIPGSHLSSEVAIWPDLTRPTSRTAILLTLSIDPPFVPDPATRYAIATLEYHLQNAEPGSASAALCDGAADGVCWMGISAAVFWGQGNPAYAVWDRETLTWQHLAIPCWLAATPAGAPSWGRIKQLYR